MFTKDFFLKNLRKILSFINGKKSDLIKSEDLTFVSLPLLELGRSPIASYGIIKDSLQMKFLDKLYSLVRCRRGNGGMGTMRRWPLRL